MIIKKRFLIFNLILVLTIFLSSCSGVPQGENPTDTSYIISQVQTGTQGVEVNFVTNYPPSTLYDINNLVALIEVKNKGNDDLEGGDCFLQITGFDPNIIRGMNYPQACGVIDGKNVYNLDGGYTQIEYESSNIQLPSGNYEYSPTFNLVLCYDYETNANPSVCLDPLFYDVTSEQKSCTPMDVSMAGGQGGPVGVTYVGVDMIGDTAVFEISIRNLGSGRVLSPYADISSCGEAIIDYDDLDKVGYQVDMTGGSLIDCSPSDPEVRLVNGVGKIVCTFRINGVTTYETPLMVTLDYRYMESVSKPMQIIKTP